MIAGDLQRFEVCRSQDDVLTTGEQWKAALVEKGRQFESRRPEGMRRHGAAMRPELRLL